MHSKEQMVCIFTLTFLVIAGMDYLNGVFTGSYRSLIEKMLLLILLQSLLKWGNLFGPWMP